MKFLRFSLGIIGVFCIVWTIIFGSSCLNNEQKELTKGEYKGILTVWHVDTFEGGEGSRKQFLLKVARRLEKENQGLLVSVIDYTISGVKEQFDKGNFPDLLSFGNGVEVKNAKELSLSNSFLAGEINGRQYSIPWCRGGYVLISKASESLNLNNQNLDKIILSQGEYTLPLGALSLEDISVDQVVIEEPLDAYNQFLISKDCILLGTQRDIVRLRNRGIEIKTRPLSKFCDLYQNIALLCDDENKLEYCDKFINQLLSQQTQSELNKISMFSVYHDVNFQNENLNVMQQVSPINTVSAFLDANTLKNLQTYCLEAIRGDEKAKIKFKNFII